MTLLDVISSAMQAQHFTSYRQLSTVLGISTSGPHLWRHGKSLPTDENMIKLAKLAGLDEADALLILNIERSAGEARAVYEAMLKARSKVAA